MQKYWLGQVLTSVFPTTYDLEPLAVFFPDIFVSIVLPCVFNGQTMNIQNVQRAIPTLIVVDCCVHRSTPRIYLVVCFCSPHSYEILMTDKCFAAIYFLETTRAWKFVTINFLHDYLFSKVFHSNKRQVVCKDNLLSFSYKKKKTLHARSFVAQITEDRIFLVTGTMACQKGGEYGHQKLINWK
jgi:hypothetical protein